MIFVNGISSLTTLSRKVILLTVENIPYCMAAQISSSLTKIVNIYTRVGFTVRVIFMDMEFEKVSDDLEMFQLNTKVAIDHMGEIKRGIRVLKERSRSVIVNLSFTPLHKK